jgi:hypothetical protein
MVGEVKSFIDESSGRGRLLALLSGVVVLASGFLAGRAIGTDDAVKVGSTPAEIATRQAPAEVPTLGAAKQIPPLERSETTSASAETRTEESSATPLVEPESPSPTPEQSSPPEVTVAPSG